MKKSNNDDDEVKEKIIEKLWERDQVRYELLYDDFILIKAFLEMTLSVEYDIHDEQLESAICELGKYLNNMVKSRINKYNKYDGHIDDLPKLEQVRYDVIADDLRKIVNEPMTDSTHFKPSSYKCPSWNSITSDELKEAIKKSNNNDDKSYLPKSWGKQYYKWE